MSFTPRFPAAGTVAALVLFAGLPTAAAAQAKNPCAGVRTCQAVADFSGTVTDFRQSVGAQGAHVIAVTLQFRNLTGNPLYLGYVAESGVITDDKGNRYAVYPASVRGIGTITAREFDPKFMLRPGESADARLEFGFRAPPSTILGTKYTMDLAVRQIEPLAGNQFRLGREHALQYGGFPEVMTAPVAATAPASPAAPAAEAAPPPEPADLCAGKPRCYAAGPFLAEVTQVVGSNLGGGKSMFHLLQITMRIRNMTSEPIILGYQAKSGTAVDDLGNQYSWYSGYAWDASAAGIGVVIPGRSADPQFRLNPGDARNATFTVRRKIIATTPIGASYTYNLVLVQMEILPSHQIRSVTESAVGFKDLTLGTSATATVNSAAEVLDALKKKINHKP
jgi:hypothetical protein